MNNNNYSYLVQALHHLVLGNKFIPELLHDIEKLIYKKKFLDVTNNNHIFINGLARSGSTILMRSIFDTKEFSSLTYRDMPFIISPNIWSLISKKLKKKNATQRLHGDNIFIDLDSPEQLEEAFWKLKDDKLYIGKNELKSYQVKTDIIEEYKKFINLVLIKYKKDNYLTKNNNNILRLDSLRKAFPFSLILITFRDPIDQSLSLLRQHTLFSEIQKKNTFTKSYMKFLAHHEFGLLQKPFVFNEINSKKYLNKNDINYWLEQWIYVYENLLKMNFVNSDYSHFICYEELLKNPKSIFDKIKKLTNFTALEKIDTKKFIIQKKKKNKILNLNENLINEAKKIYQKLRNNF